MSKGIKWAAVQPLIGGMAIGFMQATGRKPEFIVSQQGFQKNEEHLRQYWPDVPYFIVDGNYDFIDESEKVLFEKLNKDIDIVMGVPICSGLSQLNCGGQTNAAKKRGSDAAQNQNMYDITKFTLEKIKPKVLCCENAPGLYTNLGVGVRKNLTEMAESYGKAITFYKTNTVHHGIPQNRPRTFFYIWSADSAPVLDWYDLPHKELTDFLADIPKDLSHQNYDEARRCVEKDFSYMFCKKELGPNFRDRMYDLKCRTGLHYITLTPEHIERAIAFAKELGDDKAVKLVEHAKYKLSIGKGYWDWSIHVFEKGIVNAVIGRNMANGLHPFEDRYLTIREYMCLMGMPQDFNLIDDKFRHHITQNVPVCTAKAMGEECIKFVKGKLSSSGLKVVCQDNTKKRLDTKPVAEKVSLESFFG